MNKRSGYLMLAVALWDTAWKVAAILTAAKRRDFKWIGPLVIVNSAGLLPIVYLKVFAKRGEEEESAF